MVQFSGKCRCDFCQTAYQKFYGEKMPAKYDPRRFRFDTYKRWAQRAVKAGREMAPAIEISINHQWFRPDGLPYELDELFDWYYCEFTTAEWVAEILRASGGDKTTFSGCGGFDAHTVAHFIGRRLTPHGYSSGFLDYRTSEWNLSPAWLAPAKTHIAHMLGEVRKYQPYVKAASAIPHATVLFSGAVNSALGDAKYTDIVTAYLRHATRMKLTCCNVEIAERLTADKLSKYEVVFAPEAAAIDARVAALLRQWVHSGGVLFASGPAAIADEYGRPRPPTCADIGLLGMKKIGAALNPPSYLTDFQYAAELKRMEVAYPSESTIACEPATAEPVGYGQIGADRKAPLIWRSTLGDGVVFYFAGRKGKGEDEPAEKALRGCLQTLLAPHVKKAPVRTSMEYPVEVWLNEQAEEKRLVMHVVAFEKPLRDQQVSVRADLIADDALEIVYPASRKTVVKGERIGGYVHFPLPEMHEHVILVLKKA